MVKVGIIGHTGRLGKSLVKILSEHPYTKIVYTESTRKGAFGNLSDSELVFLALPYGESKKYLHSVRKKRVIDLSIDHRGNNKWIYGLPELNKYQIQDARKVANPGCYATAILEALLPIKDVVNNIKIKAFSGVSGRANQPIIKDKGIERYAKDREHPQIAEIEKYLGKRIESFEPHLVYSLKTGILAKINAQLQTPHVDSLFKKSVEDKPFVKLVDFKPYKENNIDYFKKILVGLEDSNFCHISFRVHGKSIMLISALDNLIKGGSGQAVQNFNIMYGLDETTGLLSRRL